MAIPTPPAAPNPLGTNFAAEALAFTQWMHTAAPEFNTAVNDANAAVGDAEQAVLDAAAQVGLATTQAGNASSSASTASGHAIAADNARAAAVLAKDAAEDARDMSQTYAALAGASAGLPALAGQALKQLQVKADESGVQWAVPVAGAANIVRTTKTSAYTAVAGDKGNLLDCSGSWTLGFEAAATLGAGWWCYVRNIGTGTITADPNGAELIGGATTYSIDSGAALLIQCDGSSFTLIKIGGITPDSFVVLSSGTSWTCPAGFTKAKLRIGGAGGGGRGGNGTASNGSGASGGYVEAIISITPGISYSYAIGAGGTGGMAGGGQGGDGGDTTFSANGITYTAGGGQSNFVNVGGSASGTGALTVVGSPGLTGPLSGVFVPGPSNLLGRAGGDAQTTNAVGDPGDSGLIVLELYK